MQTFQSISFSSSHILWGNHLYYNHESEIHQSYLLSFVHLTSSSLVVAYTVALASGVPLCATLWKLTAFSMLSNSRHFLAIFRPCCNFSLAFHTVVSDMLKWFAGQTPIHFFTDHFSGPGRAVSPVLRVCVSEHLSGSTSYLKSWQSVCGVFLRVSGHSPPHPPDRWLSRCFAQIRFAQLCESSVEFCEWSYAQTKVSNCRLTLTPNQTLIQCLYTIWLDLQTTVRATPTYSIAV